MDTAERVNWRGEKWRNNWSEPHMQTAQGFTKARYLSEEQIEGVISDLEEGVPIGEACRNHGTSTTQWFRRTKKEPELERRSISAFEEGKRAQQQDIWGMAWKAAREGNAKMIERLAIVMLPEWREALTTSRLQVGNVDGEALKLAALRQFDTMLSDEDLKTVIEIMERASQQELPPTANGS